MDRPRGKLDAGGTAVRWYKLYEDLDAEGEALAYPCKYNRAEKKWEADERDEVRRKIYSGSPDVTAAEGDWVQAVFMDQPARWEVIKPEAVYIGKTDGAISKGAAGNVTRHLGADRSATSPAITDSVYNLFANVASGKWVAYTKVGGVFYMIAAEC